MRLMAVVGLALSLGCISAAESPSNYQSYSGIRVDTDPVLLARYEKALQRCVPEAGSWRRGSPDPRSLDYNAVLRNCLYRRSFVDRGVYAYPIPQVYFDHFLDR
ncbi:MULTISPECIES: hypothetical protein [Rhizobium]|uniref:DUF2799 domain-containing protein n=1 Tax=Rhizobium anhuiense TaxID=1184720 RepID=A0A3S0SDQ5_9HYPH|nr:MULTISPECIES: hypothetical protein [Rhizobium]MBB3299639.1 hypothetical protein [Rhizobium sp. BK112]MBB3369093.1 hypothetical protein [Rhizobium sp. BK077]MBB3743956.1 hypothetical protein [Rhizobium sp. BK591]MBB4113579.1 hypothetical protein [Rhizobium sp. BK226]MBB4179529.1 hypothetical protein [Rhizobium sp. BK109]